MRRVLFLRLFKKMYNKTIVEFTLHDIINYQILVLISFDIMLNLIQSLFNTTKTPHFFQVNVINL